jgi:hypothetical protein
MLAWLARVRDQIISGVTRSGRPKITEEIRELIRRLGPLDNNGSGPDQVLATHTQIQNVPLYALTLWQPTVLDDAEVMVILAVFPAVGAAQKHRKQQNARVQPGRKEGRSSLSSFFHRRVARKGLWACALAKNPASREGQVRRFQ